MPHEPEEPFSIIGPFNAETDFIQLNVSPVENSPSQSGHFSLRGFVGCSTYTYSQDGRNYELSLRQIKVTDHTYGCQIIPDSIREEILQPGKVKDSAKDRSSELQSADAGARLKIKASTTTVDGGLELGAGGKVSSSSRQERATDVTYERARWKRVAGGWRIGERDGGDPLMPDGVLDGRYMHGEAWGIYRINPGVRQAKIEIQAVLPLGMLDVTCSAPRTMESLFRSARQQKSSDRATAIEALNRKVAGMVVQHQIASLQRSSGIKAANGELVMAHAEVIARNINEPQLSPPSTAITAVIAQMEQLYVAPPREVQKLVRPPTKPQRKKANRKR